MHTDSEHWRELAEFGRREPTPLAFRAMVALLDTWPASDPADRAAAIDYADKLLTAWPDAARLAPWSWCKAAAKGAVQPTWRLARALQLTPGHLSKAAVDLARLARHANLEQIAELTVPVYSEYQELSFLYHRPGAFPALKALRAADNHDDGDVRALADSPLWRTIESFEIGDLTDSLVHREDASRIVPRLGRTDPVRHLTLRSPDLVAAWDAGPLPHLRSASVFIRSIEEARALAAREELSQFASLSIAFRYGFSGHSPFEPFRGNIIEADEAAAEAFFGSARLDRLEALAIVGYSMGYWGREGMGPLGLERLIASGLLGRLKRLRLQLLPLGDEGVSAVALALGTRLETLELIDVYCRGQGAAALVRSPCMSSLRHLDLSGNRIDAERCVLLAGVEMPHLQTLDLSGPGINPYYWNVGVQPVLDAGAAAWADSPSARQLKRLRLRNCHLTDEGFASLFQSSLFQCLEVLDLSDNSFTAPALSGAAESPLWQGLRELGLDNCGLDNDAMEAMLRVKQAPALRSLRLAYNSIGPKGAAALANWPVLSRVWHLGLHDNVIGDAGLIALTGSPHLGRLLELDLEQDCWNSQRFTFSDEAAEALAGSGAFPRLDGLFTGCVDEYHGTAYAPGFTKAGLDRVRKSRWMRPACKASCSDFSGISTYLEIEGFTEGVELDDHDFRRHPFRLDEREAEPGEQRMRQVRPPRSAERTPDDAEPPKILPVLPELDADEADVVEGIQFRDPTPSVDISVRPDLSLEDRERPLPAQVGKFLSDTLGSILKASSLGYFGVGGSGSRTGPDGKTVDTHVSFSVGIKGNPNPALQLIREALWWVGAPAGTVFGELTLDLATEPAAAASRFLQLATLQVARWQLGGEPGHRIDRIPLSKAQREAVRRILAEAGAVETAGGWVKVTTGDGGTATVFVKYLDDSDNFDTLNLLVERLTPEVSSLVHRLMRECAFLLLPMAFAASAEVARTIDCDWPKVEVVTSPATLHEFLARGPYHWWRNLPTRA